MWRWPGPASRSKAFARATRCSLTLTDLNGVRVVNEVAASVVHVAPGVVGVAFAEPYEAAPAMAALASTTRAA